jgi:competence protein ComEA
MRWLKDYFYLNSREEKGIMVLVSIIIILFILQYLWIYILPVKNDLPTDIKSFGHLTPIVSGDTLLENGRRQTHQFKFDPNAIDEKGLLAVGLPGNVVQHIIHYREKGGHFKNPDDFRKIYGLTDSDFEAVKPWLQFTGKERNKEVLKIDLNTADSIQLLTVKGIGPILTHRILYMRKMLTGFISKDQLRDIYGIDHEKFEFIKNQVFVSKKHIQRLDINSSSVDDLKKNPYIRYKLATVIVNYRLVHGVFQGIEELKNIQVIDNAAYQKMAPYLEARKQASQ